MEQVNNRDALQSAFDNLGDNMLYVWRDEFNRVASSFKDYYIDDDDSGLSPYAQQLARDMQEDFCNLDEDEDEQDEFYYDLAIRTVLADQAKDVLASI